MTLKKKIRNYFKWENRKHFFVFSLLLAVFIFSCNNAENTQPAKQPITELPDISTVEVVLPYGEGMDLVKTNCMTCHSLRYIEMQPDFPPKAWEKIVDKMIKNFGAPITDSTALKIVDYLVETKGKK